MEVKVLFTDPVLEIDGVIYRHHPKGGDLVAETTTVSSLVYMGPYDMKVKVLFTGHFFIFVNSIS